MRHAVKPLWAVLLLAVALAACETTPPSPMLPEITYQHLPPLKLDVARIEIKSDYAAPLKAPNVEHLFPTPPAKALETWARDRLLAVGSAGVAVFTVVDGGATETKLKLKKGLTGAFTTEQSHRYDAVAEARLALIGQPAIYDAKAAARAERYRTIAEDATVNQRERLWFDLVDALMQDFNTTMEANIRRHLGAALR